MVYSIDTAPDDGFLSSVVPVYPAKYLATFTAAYPLGKTMVAAVGQFPAVFQVNRTSPYHFFLHLQENVAGDNGLMVIFYIILWHDASILDALFW